MVNRDKIVIENVSKKQSENTNPTYAEVVTCKNKKVSFKNDMKVHNKSMKLHNNNDNVSGNN
jgi:hypothetical protein